MWFHWCYCFLFSVLFSIALLLLSIHILPFMAFKVFYQFLFHGAGCSFSRAPFSPECCFFWLFFGLFCPVLGVCFLALHRAPISSDWFFMWRSLGPSSTQLLVCNHSDFCSHWYLAGLHFLLRTSFYRLCFSLPLFIDCASVFHPAFLSSASVLSVVCRVLFSLSASFQLVGN